MEKSIHTAEYRVFLKLLRERRKKAGLTQVELGKLLGQSQSFVSKCERGENRIDVVQLRAICQVLGITLPRFVALFERQLSVEGYKKKI